MMASERLRTVRIRLGESQATFGLRFGVDQATVHRWETNGIPARGAAQKAIERFFREIEQLDEATE